jgi:hypothetical protein
MTDTHLFALVCWMLWIGLLLAAGTATVPAPLAVALAVSIFCLWRLFRRETVLRTARLR